ncbi:hypothetical protein [Nostocoides sp.]|uniref:hypothetical protein n=1 Tax=Nostocoides sp. TaxID=1917966 RepID=UPI003C70DB6D
MSSRASNVKEAAAMKFNTLIPTWSEMTMTAAHSQVAGSRYGCGRIVSADAVFADVAPAGRGSPPGVCLLTRSQ